jgi:hypothetical protein
MLRRIIVAPTQSHVEIFDGSNVCLPKPAITQGTIDAWHSLERKEGKYLSIDDARKHPGIHELSRMELDYVRNRFLVQCEDYADRILPDTSLIKTKVVRMKDVGKVAVKYLDDPFFKV